MFQSPKNKLDFIEIHRSEINGYGLFSQLDMKKGDVVYVANDYISLRQPFYGTVQIGKSKHIMEDKLRYLNHSCSPNCKLVISHDSVTVISLKHIYAGQELVCDYSITESIIPIPFSCNCGSCLGRIMS
ncbi:MAG: SET domain-containing protein [Candidatus Thiodiazotropha sp.]